MRNVKKKENTCLKLLMQVDEFSAAMRQRVPKLSQAIEQTIAPLKHNLQTAFEKAGPSTDDSSNLASGLSDILKSRIPQLSVSIENKIRPVRDGLSSVFSRFAPTPKVNSDLVGGEDDQGDKP